MEVNSLVRQSATAVQYCRERVIGFSWDPDHPTTICPLCPRIASESFREDVPVEEMVGIVRRSIRSKKKNDFC